MQRKPLIYLAIFLILFLNACTKSKDSGVPSTTIQKLDLAVVQDIEILEITSDRITLAANGQLPSSCTNVEKKDIEFIEDAVIVSIYTTQQNDSDCETNPIGFEEEINIDLSGYQKTRLTILVNGISSSANIPNPSISSGNLEPTPSPSQELSAITVESVDETEDRNSEGESDSDNSQSTPTATEGAPQPTETPENTQGESTEVSEATPTSEVTQVVAAPTETITTTAQCTDKAAFYADVTVPDNTIFKPGDTFKKTWRIRNEGTCIWDEGYSLVFASGEIMNGALSNPLPNIDPSETAEISIDLQAPNRWGQYTGNWHFENNEGQRFGVGAGGHDYIWVQIFVDSPAPAPPSSPPSEPPSGQSGQSGQNSASCAVEPNSSFEGQVLSLINSARAGQGLNPLSLQSQLSNAAFVHSSDMACNDFIGHTGSNASSWYDRVSAQGYANYNSARENIYVGNPDFGGTPEGAFDWWMNSQIHRDNILNPNVSEVGIGYVYYPNSSYGGYYTVVFARP